MKCSLWLGRDGWFGLKLGRGRLGKVLKDFWDFEFRVRREDKFFLYFWGDFKEFLERAGEMG